MRNRDRCNYCNKDCEVESYTKIITCPDFEPKGDDDSE